MGQSASAMDCSELEFPCNALDKLGHCRQEGGSCWYMAVLNFIHLAEPLLRDNGFESSHWDTVFRFATKMSRCSQEERKAACALLPIEMQPAHDVYADIVEQLKIANVSTTGYDIRHGGSTEPLLCSIFEITAKEIVAVFSPALETQPLVWHLGQMAQSKAIVLSVFLDEPRKTADPAAVLEMYSIVNEIEILAASADRQVVGGIVSFKFPGAADEKDANHAVSWNFCCDPANKTGRVITMCESNTTSTLHRDPKAMFTLLTKMVWSGFVWDFADFSRSPPKDQCPIFCNLQAVLI